MKMNAYLVLLAVGTTAFHDTGRRIEVDVLAPSRLDAACIAEQTGNRMVTDTEYAYAKSVRPVRTNNQPKPDVAAALAA